MVTVVIGYGKVAQALIDNYDIDACFVRELSKVDSLSGVQKCVFVDRYDKLPKADIYIIAVNDDAIGDILNELKNNIPQDSLVAHCSGSVPLDVISKYFPNAVVIYPLYPFAEAVKVNFDDVTVLIECANSLSENRVIDFLGQKGCFVNSVDSQTRVKIHIAAIFACNFTNHMIFFSQQYLNEFGYDISILNPLLKRVCENITESCNSVAELQTGPAIREDYTVINSHIKMLQNNPALLDVYKYLTNSIIEHKNSNGKL